MAGHTMDKGASGVLELCLKAVGAWMRANKLKLNPDKTEVSLIENPAMQVLDSQLALDGGALPLKELVCSLGVLLDPQRN